jgi:hypothetical protein
VRAILQHSDIRRDQDLYEDVADELERDFFIQLLFSYKVNPRTVFFAGHSEGGSENQDRTMKSTSRAVFLKIGCACSGERHEQGLFPPALPDTR